MGLLLKSLSCAVALLAASFSYAASGLMPVWDVESPVFNSLGGSYNAFGSDGCQVVLQRTRSVHRGPAGHSLKIAYRNSNAASCGFWMHLFKEGSPADLPDVTRFPYLSFWIEERAKADDVEIRMADAVWLSRDDSKAAGRAAKYLQASARDQWREVVVPVRDFSLPTARAAVVALQFAPQTSGVLYVDDFCFKSLPDVQVPYVDAPVSVVTKPRRRAMWLWETTKLLNNGDLERAALDTLHEARVTDLFLQIPRSPAGQDNSKIEWQDALRHFLRKAHANGLRVHALDGDPEFSLKENHAVVLSLVRNVLQFNDASAPEERFDGIHLDNEPYQLLGFDGPSRAGIFQEYLKVNQAVATLVQSSGSGLSFGVDIPFWWDHIVEFNGVRKSAAQHIIDLTGNVGIMAYRNFASGLDGIVSHAQGGVEYAGTANKQAFVAIETFRSVPENVTFLAAIKESQWQALPPASKLLRLSRWQGYALRTFTEGGNRYVGLAQRSQDQDLTSFANALGALHSELIMLSKDWLFDLRDLQNSVVRYGKTSGEWREATLSPWCAGLYVTQEMPAKTTLANETKEFVAEILLEVGDAFAPYPGFAGDAIHSLESYQKLKAK